MSRIWTEKGTRTRLVRQQQFECAYIFRAVCPTSGDSVGLVMPYANTHAMLIHLEHIAAKIPKGRHGIIVLDRAAWHTTKKLQKFENLSILPLPTASPELNPSEQVWAGIRDEYLSNRCYEEIVDICCESWNAFTKEPKKIKQLCSRWWVNV